MDEERYGHEENNFVLFGQYMVYKYRAESSPTTVSQNNEYSNYDRLQKIATTYLSYSDSTVLQTIPPIFGCNSFSHAPVLLYMAMLDF